VQLQQTVACPDAAEAARAAEQHPDGAGGRRTAQVEHLPSGQGRRPVLGEHALLQTDPHFRDLIPFHEFFHGDTGKGLGASHQTGWTGLVALLLQPRLVAMGSLMPVARARETRPAGAPAESA
jgi:hypothetical protein